METVRHGRREEIGMQIIFFVVVEMIEMQLGLKIHMLFK